MTDQEKLTKVRELLDQKPLFSQRRRPEFMEGWEYAMRCLIDILDGEGSWILREQEKAMDEMEKLIADYRKAVTLWKKYPRYEVIK